ncbi:glycosyltransferase [Neobacillus soli]|uniref:glycosyltransferase n=1 Tax=Neobacillus soli TaxID=220688 RepID=UPI0008252E09|nr:glycosyltransferase [Neobacillus soli]
MKIKLLFMLINMNVGGTEKALLNMLSEIPKDKFDVTILMLEEYGGFLNFIPKEVNIKYFNDYKKIKEVLNDPPHLTALASLKKGKVVKAFNIMFLHIISKLINDRSSFFKYLLNSYHGVDEEYDIAVAYDGPMDFISYFVLNRVKAKRKIQWIHFDVTKIGFNSHFASKIYNKFDKVFVVSEEAKKKLISLVPSIKDKTDLFSNIVSSKLIYSQLNKGNGFKDEFDGIRILTVGRLTIEKGQDLVIRVLARLINDGFKVNWYCLGDGSLREKYQKLVEENNLQEKFIFLGADPNPYPFIKQCDIYVQPSRHEGYCISLAEARCLTKPIVTTDFTGAKEQIKNGETGLIVGVNEEEIYDAVLKLINSYDLRKKLTNNLAKENFDSTSEVLKFYSI